MSKQVVAITVDDAVRWLTGPFDSEAEAADWMDDHDSLVSSLIEDYAVEYQILDEVGTNVVDVDVEIMAMNEPEEVG